MLRGKEALRKYWSEGVRLIPDLHFEVLALYVGVNTLVINYRNQAGGVVSEVLTFEGSLVREGHGTYLSETPATLEQRVLPGTGRGALRSSRGNSDTSVLDSRKIAKKKAGRKS